MSHATDAVRRHHARLIESLARYADGLWHDPDGDAALGLLNLLQHELLGHARGEEGALYPAADELVRQHGRPTATMSIDHEHIERLATQIRETVQALGCAPAANRERLQRKLQRLVAGLETLVRVHMEKEERVYLPLVERHLEVEAQERLLAALHQVAGQSDSTAPAGSPAGGAPGELDVRFLPPARRHPLIFQTFDQLEPGGSFVLVNDHDPKPLRYQFQAERQGEFEWSYLEQGPEVWRVRIAKKAGR